MTLFTDLGPALVELRRERGKKAREVAEMAGITKAMLSSYENQHVEPSVGTLDKILHALGAELPDLDRAIRRVGRVRAKGAGLPEGPAEFGPAERAVVAEAIVGLTEAMERFLKVMHRVVVPALEGRGEEPAPQGD